jgi:two-component system, LytTR family, sensor kinase
MQFSNRSLQWVLDPRYRPIQHLLFWIVMYAPHWTAYLGITREPPSLELLPVYLFSMAIDISSVYFNLYYLIPKFFITRQYWAYILVTFLLLIFNSIIGPALLQYYVSKGKMYMPDPYGSVESFVMTFNLTMAAVGLNIIKRFLVSQARLKELETSSLKTELAFLKHQINPHFLFNSLNNIYVQSRTNHTDASDSILQLSDLLRYQLYDCGKEKVNLEAEVDYLQNYLKIDRMRKNKASVDFDVDGSPANIKVAPFLFIPFVENALKHGITMNNETKIRIRFRISAEQVIFEIENTKPEQSLSHTVKGGIGIANISRRLDLLYPGKYRLDIDNERSAYKVRLSIVP